MEQAFTDLCRESIGVVEHGGLGLNPNKLFLVHRPKGFEVAVVVLRDVLGWQMGEVSQELVIDGYGLLIAKSVCFKPPNRDFWITVRMVDILDEAATAEHLQLGVILAGPLIAAIKTVADVMLGNEGAAEFETLIDGAVSIAFPLLWASGFRIHEC